MERGDRPREGAPTGGASGEADGCQGLEGRRPGCVGARAPATTGVCERGRASAGEGGHVGAPPVSLSPCPAWGTGRPQALARSGRFAQATSPAGRPRTMEAGRYRGPSAQRRSLRGAGGSRRGAASRGPWGREAPAPHGRAGVVEPRVPRAETRGETPSAPPRTPGRPWTAAGSRGSAGGTVGVHGARPGLWGGRMGHHRLYPAADGPQRSFVWYSRCFLLWAAAQRERSAAEGARREVFPDVRNAWLFSQLSTASVHKTERLTYTREERVHV